MAENPSLTITPRRVKRVSNPSEQMNDDHSVSNKTRTLVGMIKRSNLEWSTKEAEEFRQFWWIDLNWMVKEVRRSSLELVNLTNRESG